MAAYVVAPLSAWRQHGWQSGVESNGWRENEMAAGKRNGVNNVTMTQW